MITCKVRIKGQVQGVGFRPYVYRLAKEHDLTGRVSNGTGGVEILVAGIKEDVEKFFEVLMENPPESAIINKFEMRWESYEEFKDFEIIESSSEGKVTLLPTPDLGLCESCRKEIWDSSNKRYLYPFTTCVDCGPRYSIQKGIPFDRHLTSMDPFSMCSTCQEEYENPIDRRFHSQTNSCPSCAIEISLVANNGQTLSRQPLNIYNATIEALKAGKIIAVKGIGGYLLLADATNRDALSNLRERKKRPGKPFALLYPSVSELKKDVILRNDELEYWESIESPIVLCKMHKTCKSGIINDLVAPGLDRLGVMRPYAPILEIISQKMGSPLIATSGNVSGFPIFYKNDEALKTLVTVADLFIINNRDIVNPQDDSVIAINNNKQKIIYRRSRGYAPNLSINVLSKIKQSVLCTGASIKSCFLLHHESQSYLSQYIGDTDNYDVQESYKLALHNISSLLGFEPEVILVDKHPEYFTYRYGHELSRKLSIKVQEIQHHKAHFASILAENNLFGSEKPILGIVWDGTGLGEDDQIWGGEFFIYNQSEIERIAHLEYFDVISGDKMARQPRLCAFSIASSDKDILEYIKDQFSEEEWRIFNQMKANSQGIKSSSMGRLFDAVAALLGLCEFQSYEGEAAMKLQVLAERCYDPDNQTKGYEKCTLKPYDMLFNVYADLKAGESKEMIAYRFHLSLVQLIEKVARDQNLTSIAFSGGVFQNALLVDLIIDNLKSEFDLYFHSDLSPNDENIAVGQLAYWHFIKENSYD